MEKNFWQDSGWGCVWWDPISMGGIEGRILNNVLKTLFQDLCPTGKK